MDIQRTNLYSYVIVKGWEEFVQKHKLGAMDVIRFFKPVNPSHKKHFLIEIIKNGGCGAKRAGPSHGGSYKGKEIAREYNEAKQKNCCKVVISAFCVEWNIKVLCIERLKRTEILSQRVSTLRLLEKRPYT